MAIESSDDHLSGTMAAVVLTGHGGPEKLEYRTDVAVPQPGPEEVLIRVAAAGINNTDINTRIGWYSKEVKSGTEGGGDGRKDEDASWSGVPLTFPRIQGADGCGYIVAVGSSVDPKRIGERVLVRNMLRTYVNYRPYECWTFGSECDGAFAQYAKSPSRDTYRIFSNLSDVELASIPCAYSTAENMLHRAGVKLGEHVVITGASGGVGIAAVQLAKRRGARVTAVGRAEKKEQMLKMGADTVVSRVGDETEKLGKGTAEVVIDLVGGPGFPDLLDLLKRGGRYAVAGAIAGPLVELDLRSLYLKDLTFYGCTFQEDEVFSNLLAYIERGDIKPLIGAVFALKDIAAAQEHFVAKRTAGKIVLTIP